MKLRRLMVAPCLSLLALLLATPMRVAGTPFCPADNGLFVLYYGEIVAHPTSGSAQDRIRVAEPSFVVVNQFPEEYKNKNDLTDSFRHDKDHHPLKNRVIAYVSTDFGKQEKPEKKLKAVLQEVGDAMDSGYDGVFFDEVDNGTEGSKKNFYRRVAERVRNKKNGQPRVPPKLVIFNPGESKVQSWLFEYADIVSVENKFNQPRLIIPPTEEIQHPRILRILPHQLGAGSLCRATQAWIARTARTVKLG